MRFYNFIGIYIRIDIFAIMYMTNCISSLVGQELSNHFTITIQLGSRAINTKHTEIEISHHLIKKRDHTYCLESP